MYIYMPILIILGDGNTSINRELMDDIRISNSGGVTIIHIRNVLTMAYIGNCGGDINDDVNVKMCENGFLWC
jgi:hypothetical protein